MVVYLSTESGVVTADRLGQTALNSIEVKRGTDLDLYVLPDTQLQITTPGFFAAAAVTGGSPLALASWAPPENMEKGWLFAVSLRGAALAAMFAAGVTSVALNAEITVIVGGKRRKSQTIRLDVTKEVHDETSDPTPPDVANTRRTNSEGYQEYSFDQGQTWWLYSPVVVDGTPEWQWRLLP